MEQHPVDLQMDLENAAANCAFEAVVSLDVDGSTSGFDESSGEGFVDVDGYQTPFVENDVPWIDDRNQ